MYDLAYDQNGARQASEDGRFVDLRNICERQTHYFFAILARMII